MAEIIAKEMPAKSVPIAWGSSLRVAIVAEPEDFSWPEGSEDVLDFLLEVRVGTVGGEGVAAGAAALAKPANSMRECNRLLAGILGKLGDLRIQILLFY
jgi:hypothetical protein